MLVIVKGVEHVGPARVFLHTPAWQLRQNLTHILDDLTTSDRLRSFRGRAISIVQTPDSVDTTLFRKNTMRPTSRLMTNGLLRVGFIAAVNLWPGELLNPMDVTASAAESRDSNTPHPWKIEIDIHGKATFTWRSI